MNPGTDTAKYVINIKQIAKVGLVVLLQPLTPRSCPADSERGIAVQFVVGLGDKVAPTDIEEGMRVGQVPPPPHELCKPSLLTR